MNFANVLLICIGAIAVCAALVFAVETLVAFCFHEQERDQALQLPGESARVDQAAGDMSLDRAA